MPITQSYSAQPMECEEIRRRAPRMASWTLLPALFSVSVAVSADKALINMEDSQVLVDESGTIDLPFVNTREGDSADSGRPLLQTTEGGGNPGVPGKDNRPSLTGTEILLAPGGESDTVDVEVLGRPESSPDKSLFLQIAEAGGLNPQPQLRSNLIRIGDVCCAVMSLEFADFNGDGHPDIVTGNGMTGTLTILLKNGEDGYIPPENYQLPELHRQQVEIAVADVSGDGHSDIVASGYHSSDIAVFLGDGNGGLSEPDSFTVGSELLYPDSIALADVTDNGHLDIVTANTLLDGGETGISILEGNGKGEFESTEIVAETGHWANAIAIADINEDNHPDIISSDPDKGNVILLINEGNGKFAPSVSFSIGNDSLPTTIAIVDIIGDGNLDIVTGNDADNGLPFPDPNLPGSISILQGDGSGGFSEPVQLQIDPGLIRGVVVADATGNGHADILVTRLDHNAVTVLSNQGQGEFIDHFHLQAPENPQAVAISDVTSDGLPNIVIGHNSGITAFQTGDEGEINPGNNFTVDQDLPVNQEPLAMDRGDLNGDGYPDIATANSRSDSVSIFLNDQSGAFMPAVSYPVDTSPMVIEMADVNSDSAQDLVVANAAGASVSVLIGDGDGEFTDAVNYAVSDEWIIPFAMATGDVTGDGHTDIITANTHQVEGRDYLSMLAGSVDGTFAEPITFPLGDNDVFHAPESLYLADLNSSGYLDIVTANSNSNNISLLINNGQGNFEHSGYLDAGPTPVAVAAGDVTGNGNPDLVVVNTSTHAISVLEGDGLGDFSEPVSFEVAPVYTEILLNPWPVELVLADITKDEYLDVITANPQNGTISALSNNGEGEFPEFQVVVSGARPKAVAVADFNGDGSRDVAVANQDNDSIALLLNESQAGVLDPLRVPVLNLYSLGLLGLLTVLVAGLPSVRRRLSV